MDKLDAPDRDFNQAAVLVLLARAAWTELRKPIQARFRLDASGSKSASVALFDISRQSLSEVEQIFSSNTATSCSFSMGTVEAEQMNSIFLR
jgi:hypothetical protein